MTEPLTPPPQFAPGSPELAEWEAIAAAPSRHIGLPLLAPDDPAHLEQLEAHRFKLALLAAPDEHARSLSGAGVLFGPDCSQYQGRPDWSAVRAAGCVIGGYKVSEGRTFIDPTHVWNRAQTKAAGLVPLAYHYLFYSDAYAADPSLWGRQADWFVNNADPDAIHCLDVEAPATSGHHLGVREWVAQYRRRLPGHPLGFYANRALWTNRSRMPYDPAGLFDFVWHAGVGNGYYTSAKGTIQEQWSAQGGLVNSFAASGYPACKLWQITDHARVPGVGGTFCDGNAFIGTLTQLRALATGKADEDMPLTDAEIDKIAARVWAEHMTNRWDGSSSTAENMLTSAAFYAAFGSIDGTVPKTGTTAAGSDTPVRRAAAALAKLVGQTDTLEASDAAQSAALAGLNADALADAIVAKLPGGSVDVAAIRQALRQALEDVRLTTQTTT